MLEWMFELISRKHPPRKVAFLHIPKCAGTSVNKFLKSHLGSARSGRTIMLNSIDLLHRERLSGAQLRSASYVAGHCGWADLADLSNSHFRFTILRSPAERILSLYDFCRTLPPEKNTAHFPLAAAKRLSFKLFCEAQDKSVRMFVDNAQARTLADNYTKLDDELPPNWDDVAVRNLEALDFVTTCEQLNARMRHFCALIGLPEPKKPIQLNVRRDPPTDLPDVHEAEAILGARIAIDQRLYEMAARQEKLECSTYVSPIQNHSKTALDEHNV